MLKEEKNYELLNTCNKCGFCVQGCSVYKEHLNEAYGTRGRIRLIKAVADGELDRTPLYEKIINSCLMCGECSKNCPSGVQGDKLVKMARKDLVKEKGLPLVKKIPLEKVLPNNNMRKFSFNTFRVFKNVFVNPINSLHSFKGINIKDLPIAKKDFLSIYRPTNSENAKMKVGFFVGCMMNHTMPEVAQSIVKVLEKHGCEVIIPKEQRCCGTPAHVYGHAQVSKEVALDNIQLFNSLGVEKIVTACASCGSMLKNYNEVLTDNDQVQEFTEKVRDVTQFLVDDLNISFTDYQSSIAGKVTYHDPCHLVRGQNISEQPRKIMRELKGIEYVEMPGASKCCGASGMFQGFYPEEAISISTKKVENIEKTQAEYVITNCPACHHRIQGTLKLNEKPQKVLHIMQLLDPETHD